MIKDRKELLILSRQMTDPFIWKNRKYEFIGASEVYSLFNPEFFGLKPTAPHTACYKGFVVHFMLKKGQLYVDRLEVFCEDKNYPAINNVEAQKDEYSSFYIYDNLDLPLNYTGNIVIGEGLIETHSMSVCKNSYSYRKVYELCFVNGKLKWYGKPEKKKKQQEEITICQNADDSKTKNGIGVVFG